jgi:endonuclease YncB( thermonuclease family)
MTAKPIQWIVTLCWLLAANSALATTVYRDIEQGHAAFSDIASPQSTKVQLSDQANRYRFAIKYVYDGDTIKLENGDSVRFIGINTPEIHSRYRQGEPGGEQATAFLKQQLSGGEVLLQYDQQQRDHYDRQLAYCYTPEGINLNVLMLKQGYASLSIHPPNLYYLDEMVAAQNEAIQQRRGIWAMPEYQAISAKELAKLDKLSGWKRIRGVVREVVEQKKQTVLRLDHGLSVRIPKKSLKYFAKLEQLKGKNIEVRGWPKKRGDAVIMYLRHGSSIQQLND